MQQSKEVRTLNRKDKKGKVEDKKKIIKQGQRKNNNGRDKERKERRVVLKEAGTDRNRPEEIEESGKKEREIKHEKIQKTKKQRKNQGNKILDEGSTERKTGKQSG